MAKQKLIARYKIFHLAKCLAQPDDFLGPDDGPENLADPDYVLGTLKVPYIDNTIMPVYSDFYETEQEAIAAIEKSGASNEIVYVIQKVYVWVHDW